jgi:UV DNA damage endonuclease
MRLGYACINTELNKQKITTNRGMIKRTFLKRGIPYASQLALKNISDLIKILEWNTGHDIRFFRLSSDLFPWSSEYSLKDLPDYEEISEGLKRAGDYARANGMRITTHPGPFNVLGSPNQDVVTKTIKELETHAEVFNLMGLPESHDSKINIHVGGVYGDFEATAKRWVEGFRRLSPSVQSRLTLENDDKASMWSVEKLYSLIYKTSGVPLVFDYHHHRFCSSGDSEKDALEKALSTWSRDATPVVHYSQSKSVELNDPKIKPQAHSHSYWEAIDLYGNEADVMLECKGKEQGLFKMVDLLSQPPC